MKKKFKIILTESFVSIFFACFTGFVVGSAVIGIVVLLVLLVLVSIKPGLFIINKMIKRTRWYQIKTGYAMKFRHNIPHHLDICNVGSTSARYAFDYNGTGYKGANWALSPQTLSYDFRILKNYFSYLKEGATVLLPLCPFSGCVMDYIDDKYNFKYYSFLHPVLINNYSPQTRKKIMMFVDKPFQSSPLKSVIRIIKDSPSERTQASMNSEEIRIDAAMRIESWKNEFGIPDLDAPVANKYLETISYNSNLLADIVNFCIERQLKPVFIIPPMAKDLSSQLSESFRENYLYSLMSKIPSDNKLLLNYLDDDRFLNNYLYADSYLLNINGSRLFTKSVLIDLGIV